MSEINKTPHQRRSGYPEDPMYVRWYPRPNDVIGGWCVMPVDEPPSQGCYEVADFIGEQEARHIAYLHNCWLRDIARHAEAFG